MKFKGCFFGAGTGSRTGLQPVISDEAPYAVAKKYIDNCYTIGYNSNTWFGYVLYPLIYHAVSATNPIVR